MLAWMRSLGDLQRIGVESTGSYGAGLTPHHDGRMHRSQKSKKPFTVEELMEKGLTKVG
jgi:hypothetical protein